MPEVHVDKRRDLDTVRARWVRVRFVRVRVEEGIEVEMRVTTWSRCGRGIKARLLLWHRLCLLLRLVVMKTALGRRPMSAGQITLLTSYIGTQMCEGYRKITNGVD